jgi:hypothetical protein
VTTLPRRARARELGLRADGRRPLDHPLLQRVEALRAQLARRVAHHFDESSRSTPTIGDPRVNRPRAWTKDVGDDEEEH